MAAAPRWAVTSTGRGFIHRPLLRFPHPRHRLEPVKCNAADKALWSLCDSSIKYDSTNHRDKHQFYAAVALPIFEHSGAAPGRLKRAEQDLIGQAARYWEQL